MREIKFRAWNTRDLKMDIAPYNFEFDADNNCRSYEDWRDFEDGRSYPCVIMQFTGLKDKNGVDIYEGDIIKHDKSCNLSVIGAYGETSAIKDSLWLVKCMLSGYCLLPDNKPRGDSQTGHVSNYSFWNATPSLTVIGNIYQDPDLLK